MLGVIEEFVAVRGMQVTILALFKPPLAELPSSADSSATNGTRNGPVQHHSFHQKPDSTTDLEHTAVETQPSQNGHPHGSIDAPVPKTLVSSDGARSGREGLAISQPGEETSV